MFTINDVDVDDDDDVVALKIAHQYLIINSHH